MALEITLIKTPGNIVLPRNNHIFDQSGGTFGRADTNTWVLPDPEKFLSSCHCEIVFAGGQFHLEDKSTNGTFINGGFEPLGRGVRRQLFDGDFFEIGDYRFAIKISTQRQGSFSSPFDFAPEPSSSIAPFDATPQDDFFASGNLETPPFFDQQQDPLALWDNHSKNGAPSFAQEQRYLNEKKHDSLLDDFIGSDNSANGISSVAMSLTPGIDQAVVWPSAKTESLIPEDWADEFSSSPKSASSSVSFINEAPEKDDHSPFAVRPAAEVNGQPFEIPRPNVRVPLAERIFGLESNTEAAVPANPAAPQVKQMVSSANTQSVKLDDHISPEQQASAHAVTGAMVASADRTLVEALGLDMSRLSDADVMEISRVTGTLMREIVDGMLGVLRSRASIKNEFRMNVTTIQPIENNPLKFSVCVDDALENLFIKKSNAYKKPVDAFREGFQEIAEHQLAMIAGIRQGFDAMMERFDPEQLEKTFSKQTKGSVIPGMQKAKFWSAYTEYYQGFTDNMEFSFQHLFGSDFVTAYEDQLRRLAAARKRGDAQND